LKGVQPGAHAYFVHSYVLGAGERRHVLASCDYGGPFAAIAGRDNMVGTQFHVEKSQATGLTLIGNFLAWRP
jgi:glutamine amidotransferase